MVTRHSPLATRLRRAKPRGHFPTPHNRLHRRTLPCLPRAPNSFSKWWPVFRRVGARLHSQPQPRPARQSQHKPLQLQPLPHLRHQPTPHKHPLPNPHPLPPLVIMGVAKDLLPSSQPHSLGPLRQPLNATTHCRPPPRPQNSSCYWTPELFTPTTTAASA